MSKAPILIEMDRRRKVADVIRKCLVPYDLQDEIDETRLLIRTSFIVEMTGNEKLLSRAILDTMFPKEPAPCTLFHYTSIEGLKGIASSGELRLYPVRKRLGPGGGKELEAFAATHRLQGYLRASEGEPFINELSNDLFYASMTRVPPKDPSYMWGYFAEGTGVRLEIHVHPKLAELRPIVYHEAGSVTLLNKINENLAAIDEPAFVPWTLSRIGAFYLSSTVSSEGEVRLLVKRFPSRFDHTANDGKWEYWPIKFGMENDVCDLELEGIRVAPSGAKGDVEAAIAGTALAGAVITGP